MSCGFPEGKEALKFRLDETGKNKKKKGWGGYVTFLYTARSCFTSHVRVTAVE